jgi:uroporphyrinogen-III decarboxylase
MSSTTVRDTLLRALNQQTVDRIPVSPFIHVNHVKEFFGSHEVDCVERTPEVYAHYGFDLMHRNCSIAYDAFGPPAADWSIAAGTQSARRDSTTQTVISTPGGSLRWVEEVRWVYEWDSEASVVEFPIGTREDFDLLRRFQPPLGPVDAGDIRRARQCVGHDGVVAPWIQGAFNLAAVYYRKVDDLFVDALTDPVFYAEMMRHFLGRYMQFVGQLIDAGADVLSCGGNIANGKMVSPEFFREHIWPYEKSLIDFVQSRGAVLLYHNCGYARRLIPVYPSLGMKAYESLTPPPYGDTVLAEAIDAFGTGTTLLGGVDQMDLLRKGSPKEIEAAVRRVLETVRGRCHFILGTTDYFNENTPAEKIRVFADAGRRYGAL